MNVLQLERMNSPLGTLLLVVEDGQLCALDYEDYEVRMRMLLRRRFGEVAFVQAGQASGISERLRAYFEGDLTGLDTIPVNPGGTPFQQQVWLSLRTIPAGMTRSYGELAAQLGKPTAYRAVGGTNALNPIAIVLPCHRVVGSNAALTGYAGGLERKRWLLEHEKIFGAMCHP